jgi:hypothetical protein
MVSIMNACDAFLYYDRASSGVPFYHGSSPSLCFNLQNNNHWFSRRTKLIIYNKKFGILQ